MASSVGRRHKTYILGNAGASREESLVNHLKRTWLEEHWLFLLIAAQPLLDTLAYFTQNKAGTVSGYTRLAVMLALFACVLFLGSAILSTADINPKTPDGQPLVAAAGLVFSIALAIYTVKHMSKKK